MELAGKGKEGTDQRERKDDREEEDEEEYRAEVAVWEGRADLQRVYLFDRARMVDALTRQFRVSGAADCLWPCLWPCMPFMWSDYARAEERAQTAVDGMHLAIMRDAVMFRKEGSVHELKVDRVADVSVTEPFLEEADFDLCRFLCAPPERRLASGRFPVVVIHATDMQGRSFNATIYGLKDPQSFRRDVLALKSGTVLPPNPLAQKCIPSLRVRAPDDVEQGVNALAVAAAALGTEPAVREEILGILRSQREALQSIREQQSQIVKALQLQQLRPPAAVTAGVDEGKEVAAADR